MVEDVCVNGTMVNTNNYSSPVPLVGVYVAATSMVCFLFILCDVWAGFRRRKFWFPCQFFSINSVTLTLISIATKLPVDLTTTMPSAHDQLSKLCGTVFICAAMSFMLPSIATNAEFESYANVISMTIFVITVVVNICIQLATGVIFSFIPEHMIILVCMLFLLIRFWASVTALSVYKAAYADKSYDFIRNGDGNMLARLKQCYKYCYDSCPQLYASMLPILGDVAVLCFTCFIVLLQATLRSKHLRFCGGVSDYGWSTWFILVSQSLTVLLVTFAIGGRRVFNIGRFDEIFDMIDLTGDPYIQFQYIFSFRKIPKFAEKTFRVVIYMPIFMVNFFLGVLSAVVHLCFRLVLVSCWHEERVSSAKGEADMERWIEINKRASPQNVTTLLSSVPPSGESPYSIGLNGQGIEISSLHLVLLAEIAKLLKAPISEEKVPLGNILDEVFEIIHFIDNELNISSSTSRLDVMMASVIHRYSLTAGLGEFTLEQRRHPRNHKVEFEFEPKVKWWLCNAHLMYEIPEARIDEATRLLNDCIHHLSGESSDVVYGRMEQLFVDMIATLLAQLPAAIYNHLLDSPVEEYEKRVRLGLGFICKLESLKSYISFSLPPGVDITSLYDTQSSPTDMQMQGRGTAEPAPVVESGEIQEVQSPEQPV